MPNAPKAPNKGPSSRGLHRGYWIPVAPPAQETRFHNRTSVSSGMRPSSRGLLITCGCIHNGPASASACQNGLPLAPPRTRSTAWYWRHGASPCREATNVKPQRSTCSADRHSSCALDGMELSVPATPCAEIKCLGSSLRNSSTRQCSRSKASSNRNCSQSRLSEYPPKVYGGSTSSQLE